MRRGASVTPGRSSIVGRMQERGMKARGVRPRRRLLARREREPAGQHERGGAPGRQEGQGCAPARPLSSRSHSRRPAGCLAGAHCLPPDCLFPLGLQAVFSPGRTSPLTSPDSWGAPAVRQGRRACTRRPACATLYGHARVPAPCCLSGKHVTPQPHALCSSTPGGAARGKGNKGKRYGAGPATADTALMDKLGDTIAGMRADFIVVHLQEPCSFCRGYISGAPRCAHGPHAPVASCTHQPVRHGTAPGPLPAAHGHMQGAGAQQPFCRSSECAPRAAASVAAAFSACSGSIACGVAGPHCRSHARALFILISA